MCRVGPNPPFKKEKQRAASGEQHPLLTTAVTPGHQALLSESAPWSETVNWFRSTVDLNLSSRINIHICLLIAYFGGTLMAHDSSHTWIFNSNPGPGVNVAHTPMVCSFMIPASGLPAIMSSSIRNILGFLSKGRCRIQRKWSVMIKAVMGHVLVTRYATISSNCKASIMGDVERAPPFHHGMFNNCKLIHSLDQ